jgi:hypothetical protein
VGENITISKLKYLFSLLPFLITSKAYAMCPVCTLAVGSTLMLLEKYGVDNTISGLWIGGLLVSASVMTINWLKKRRLADTFTDLLIFIFYYASLVLVFHHKGIIGNPTKMIWGMDKVLFSIGLGSILFYLASLWYLKIKERNKGHAKFPFQRVVMPIFPLIILSIIFYFLTK